MERSGGGEATSGGADYPWAGSTRTRTHTAGGVREAVGGLHVPSFFDGLQFYLDEQRCGISITVCLPVS